MEQGTFFSEADSSTASKEINNISRKPDVHYRVNNSPPFVPILRQMSPVHVTLYGFLKIHFNIILPSLPRSSKWSLSFLFSHQSPLFIYLLAYTCYMPCQYRRSFICYIPKTKSGCLCPRKILIFKFLNSR
jgi:hypothetical protein